MKSLLIPIAAAALLCSCSAGRSKAAGGDPNGADASTAATDTGSASAVAQPVPPEKIARIDMDSIKKERIPDAHPAARPKAVLYKTTGNYSDNVPVQLNPDGTLLSFPAPTDIPANPRPVELNGGWLLSPMGVTSRTVFTRWTYAEYRAMPQAPTPDEILKAVIAGARVTLTYALPMTPAEALADTAAVNRLLGPTAR